MAYDVLYTLEDVIDVKIENSDIFIKARQDTEWMKMKKVIIP
jgi:hypothetical protein